MSVPELYKLQMGEMMEQGKIALIAKQELVLLPIEVHVAESKWQFCNCETCQRKRNLLDSLPGKAVDYATFRLPGERY